MSFPYVTKAIISLQIREQVCYYRHFNDVLGTISHPDILNHTLDVKGLLEKGAQILLVGARRTGGTGHLKVYPNEGAQAVILGPLQAQPVMATLGILNERIEYSQSVAGATFDLYCFGYWVQGDPRL